VHRQPGRPHCSAGSRTPAPAGARPNKDLRWAAGLLLTLRRLEEVPPNSPLTPRWPPSFSKTLTRLGWPAACWSSALPPWRTERGRPCPARRPELWPRAGGGGRGLLLLMAVVGLALAAWECEGPNHPHRGPADRVFLLGAAPTQGLADLGQLGAGLSAGRGEAARRPGGRASRGAPQRPPGDAGLGAFLQGVELNAAHTAEVTVKALDLVRGTCRSSESLDARPAPPLAPTGAYSLASGGGPAGEMAKALEVTQRTAGLLATKLNELGLVGEVTGGAAAGQKKVRLRRAGGDAGAEP